MTHNYIHDHTDKDRDCVFGLRETQTRVDGAEWQGMRERERKEEEEEEEEERKKGTTARSLYITKINLRNSNLSTK